jgi:hypothetical protein
LNINGTHKPSLSHGVSGFGYYKIDELEQNIVHKPSVGFRHGYYKINGCHNPIFIFQNNNNNK